MKIKNNVLEVQKILASNFSNQTIPVSNNIALCSLAMVMSESCKTPEIISQMCRINDKTFDTNERRLERFLQSNKFQIDDKLWRRHIKMIFELLKEHSLKEGSLIAINVDMTSDADDFLILSASIPFHGRGIPLYNTMRCYPKKKGQLNQKKMEQAFIKELAHLLPKKYRYVIVADRGFGNGRFIELCEENNFLYLLRLSDGINVEVDGKPRTALKMAHSNALHDTIDAYVPSWDKRIRLVTSKINTAKQAWHIVTNLYDFNVLDIVWQYGKRFSIEKMFQDEKSSGFLIENSKIRKYQRFRRLLFLVYVAQAILLFIGDFIEDNDSDIKKNWFWCTNLLSAFSRLPGER